MSRTKVVVLGTGSPKMNARAAQTSLAVLVDDQSYCIDCGSGMMRRVFEAHEDKGFEQLAMPNLKRMFLTHLHPDHTVDLAAFLISPWVIGRNENPHIYGPKGTAEMVAGLIDAYQVGVDELMHYGPHVRPALEPQVHAMTTDVFYEDALVSIEAFPVVHGNLETYGLRIVTPDKVVVFSADTCPVPLLEEKAKDCDVLIHEAYSETSLEGYNQQWHDYFRRVHTSAREVGELAKKTNPGLVVLTHHMIFAPLPRDILLTELREVYDGPAVVPKDLDAF